tara:strand:- start:307 stop:1590 length:1284 start_codon:yes stop_codon:yes gene_type:complete
MQTTQKLTNVQYQLVRIYENRESIAFYEGGTREFEILWNLFDSFLKSVRDSMLWQIGLQFFTELLEDITIVFPYLVIAPLYFGGEIEYGIVSQSTMAFHRVRNALNIIVNNFSSISSIRATTIRLKELLDDLENYERTKILPMQHQDIIDVVDVKKKNNSNNIINKKKHSKTPSLLRKRKKKSNNNNNNNNEDNPIIHYSHDDDNDKYALVVDSLTLNTPSISSPVTLCNNLSFKLPFGSNLLISGTTGCGKSSLLRCFANLWKAKKGFMQFGCEKKKILFIPQTPYIPIGTLRNALLYPNNSDNTMITDEMILKVLQNEARLPDLIERVDNGLDSNKNWSELLSHGEQQRIAFARVFLQKPSIVLCDESTSAVDENTEMKLYSHLAVVVPTIISIAHRSSLAKFHNHTLTYNSTYNSKWKRGQHIM